MKRKLTLIILTLVMAIALVGCLDLRAEDPYTSPATYEQTRISMLQTVESSVVAVQTETGFGSGIIFKSEPTTVEGETLYYVLTNNHVVKDGGELKIYYGDERSVIPAQDVQTNPAYDIAVVRFVSDLNFTVKDIKQINDNVKVEIVAGQDVYAIGTPNDLANFNYITQGVVSLTTQTYDGIKNLAIMHDAELNPGNSGGPLFNLNGDVIALNVAKDAWITTENGDIAAEGLNYALNMNTIAPIIRGFTEANYDPVVRTPKLGVSVVIISDYLTQNPGDADKFEANAQGAVVVGFDYTRDAANYLENLDLIVGINGNTVTALTDISSVLDGANFGDTISLTIVRLEGTSFVNHTYDITLS